MCGIIGFTGRPDIELLGMMADSIIHRGPDDNGYYSDGKINLGIRRLSIIDVETGKQPVHNEDKTIWCVFNGEIYNHIELREDLQKKGHKFYTDHSDTEVLVHLYEEYGAQFAHKLNGMFAVALWNSTSEELLIVRDRMGVKPLFYSEINGRLTFASEIKSILLHPQYHKDINYDAVYHYFTFKNIPAPLTAFKNIYSLLPGEMIVYKDNKIEKIKYWTLKYREDYSYDIGYVKDKIISILEDAVKIRMRSDVPFGAYLSGGVDSSAVVGIMSRFASKPIKTFSLGYNGELKNKDADLFHARRVSRYYKTEHHEYIMSSSELVEDIGSVIRSFDQPFSGTISTYFLSKLISRHVKVAISGDGADELFGSYLSHRIATPMYYYKQLYQKIQDGSISEQENALYNYNDMAYLDDLYVKSGGEESLWRYYLYYVSDEEKDGFLSDIFKDSRDDKLSSQEIIRNNFKDLTGKDPLNRILEMEWNTQFPDQVLAFVDSLSMAHSVEVRSPFVDYRLAEFCATIPGNLKIKDGNVKDILKQSVEHLLPEGITKRPKEGFVLPVFDWMMGELKDYSLDCLSKKKTGKHGFFNDTAISGYLEKYASGQKNMNSKIWTLMMFQCWWEQYFG
jgi:asparagine synthase (glutamine-hydrolysing)